MEKYDENERNMLKLEEHQEEINQVDLTGYSELLLALINQLSSDQQKKLKKIIYQNSQLDLQSAKKYEQFKRDENGNIRYMFDYGSYQSYGMIHSSSINFSGPYELDVVNEYERENNVSLPLELKVYLTCVSSSVYKTHLDYQKIKLGKLEKMPTIIKGVRYYRQTELNDDIDYDDPNYDEKLEELIKEKDTTIVLKLRECGCGYTDLIVLNSGDNFGQVWHEKFAGDGVFAKVNESFFDYALTIISN
jgi:hypothetical protein